MALLKIISYRAENWLLKRKLRALIFLSRKSGTSKRIFFYAATLLFTLSAIEGFSAAFFYYAKDRFTFYNSENYLFPAKDALRYTKYYDYELGWDNKLATRFGERSRPVVYKEDLMSTYGDSYTYCDQVEDHETWQTYLGKLTGKNVYNFGVGGYGTDQAYLRFKRDFGLMKSKLVTLALIQENIGRTLNVYRKFYFPKTKGPMPKPRFTLNANGELELLSNPVKRPEDLVKLSDPVFLEKIGKNDHWYNMKENPILSFPYTKIFFNRNFWRQVDARWNKISIDDITPRPADHNALWKSDHSKLMFAIFDNFVRDAKEQGAAPIIMLIPTIDDANYRWKTGENPESFQIIIEYCKRKKYNVFNALDGIIRGARLYNDVRPLYAGHLSPEGNKALAKSFYEYLSKNRLI